jgi:hypothetical protein
MRKETTLIIIIYLYSSLKSFLKKVELYPFFIIFNEEKINGNGGDSVSIRVVEVMARERKNKNSRLCHPATKHWGPA